MLPETEADVYINDNYSANLASGNNITVESVSIGADGSNNVAPPAMEPNTRGSLTIAYGATLTATKGGIDGSNGVRLEGVSGNESTLFINGTLNIESDASGDGMDIKRYTSVTVGTTGILNVAAKIGHGIQISDDLSNSGTIEITANSNCQDGIRYDSPVAAGATITNNSAGVINISGGGEIDHGILLTNAFTFNNYGTVIISDVDDNILEGEVFFNNYGTFAGDGIVNAKNFNAGGSGATISPGTPAIPVGKLTFYNPVDLSHVDLDIDISGAANYDQIELAVLGSINISDAILNLSGAYVPVIGNNFMLIENNTGNPITGTFFGLPEGGTLVFNGVELTISYSGGDGNDIEFSALAPLPVELVAFSGYAEERSNLLKWQTASEENAMVFIVERSLDGIGDFIEITRVDAVGNSTSLNNYQAEDLSPADLAYYRLRMVDFDGTYEFSNLIVIERAKTEIELVEIFPIPALDEVTVLIHTQNDSKAILTLSDFMGRKIKEENVQLKSGTNRFIINWQDHETNYYFLTIYNGKERIAKKILRASND